MTFMLSCDKMVGEMDKEYMRQYQRNRRLRASEKGLCIICTKRPTPEGYKTCKECRHSSSPRKYANLPPKPIICPICESIPDKFYWHHWHDFDQGIGMWLCPYCNIVVELEDKGLVDRYKCLKREAEQQIKLTRDI